MDFKNLLNNCLQRSHDFVYCISMYHHASCTLFNNQTFLENVNETIQHYYTDPKFSFDQLAEKMGTTKERLQRRLMAIKADPPATLIRNARMNRAVELINETKLNVSQIAYSIGYQRPDSFLLAFKKRFGMTPYEMMKLRANHGVIKLPSLTIL